MTVQLVCDGCGQVFERKKGEVTRSRKLGRKFFCGRSCLGKNRDNSVYKNTGNASWLMPNNRRDSLTPFRWYMARIRYRSHWPSDLTIENLVEQWNSQNGTCPFTGWVLVLPDNTSGWKNGIQPNCASLDRIDSTLGYMKSNVIFVSVMYNFAKKCFW